MSVPFWKKPLLELSPQEWEAICDGCGKCCLFKLEDEDSGVVYYTRVACRLLDLDTCRCTRYAERVRHVPDCTALIPEQADRLEWLPTTCAYRLLAQGDELPAWHPLICGDAEAIHRAGASVRGLALSETAITDLDCLEDYLMDEPP